MALCSFTHPIDSPGLRRAVLPPRLCFDLPLQGLEGTCITRAQTPLTSLTGHRKAHT